MPVFCKSDKDEVGSESLSNLPRAVIQLINKNDPNGFTQRVYIYQNVTMLLGHCKTRVFKQHFRQMP